MHDQTGANPYAAPTARIQAQADASDGFQLASRGTRLGAYMLDGLVVGGWFGPIYYSYFTQRFGASDGPGVISWLCLAIGLAVFAYNLVQLHRTGQSIAKKWLGIRIVRKDGSRAGLGRIFSLRMLVPFLISAIPVLGALFGLIDALCIFGDDRRTLHDRIADTIVVDA